MIDILLATYNGEKYLDTQIASIVNQTFKKWTLYICDDNSHDNTQTIIKKWALLDERIKIIDDKKANIGIGKNFLHLLKYSTADYICFCDQDDYWFENKLDILYEAIEGKSPYLPVLIIHEIISWSYPSNRVQSIIKKKPKALENFLFLNGGLQGCASIFNAKLREYFLLIEGHIWMHDHYMSLIAMTFGEIVYINNILVLYRQHTNNATIHLPTSKLSLLKIQMIKNKNIHVIYRPSYKDVENFYKTFQENIHTSKKKLFQDYLSFPKMPFLKRFITISFSKFALGNRGHFQLLIKLLLRKYCRWE
jgi:rhamnosyltransferase